MPLIQHTPLVVEHLPSTQLNCHSPIDFTGAHGSYQLNLPPVLLYTHNAVSRRGQWYKYSLHSMPPSHNFRPDFPNAKVKHSSIMMGIIETQTFKITIWELCVSRRWAAVTVFCTGFKLGIKTLPCWGQISSPYSPASSIWHWPVQEASKED